jgi:hypothetical protein
MTQVTLNLEMNIPEEFTVTGYHKPEMGEWYMDIDDLPAQMQYPVCGVRFICLRKREVGDND